MMRIVFIFLLLTILFACFTKKVFREDLASEKPSGNSLRINDHAFIDRTEVSNSSYLYFTKWIKWYFGDTSNVYQHVVPDTTVWLGQVANDTFLMTHYFRSEQFRYFPVVGVSQAQARLYSKWRADRVFHAMLIRNNIIDGPYFNKSNELFTIEKYLSGEYENYKPDPRLLYYPVFRLPEKHEIEQAQDKFEKVRLEYFLDCRDEHCNYCHLDEYQYASRFNVQYQLETFGSPTRHIRVDCRNIMMFEMHNLKGNVAEWMSAKDSTFGGSWKDKIKSDHMIYDECKTRQSATVGFRNVSEWKRIYRPLQ